MVAQATDKGRESQVRGQPGLHSKSCQNIKQHAHPGSDGAPLGGRGKLICMKSRPA